MGIAGLLPLVKPYSKTVNINMYSGCKAAVDAYCWLHKGAIACADRLFEGDDCTRYVNYCVRYVDMLLSHNIRPILVFDGRHLPAKAEVEKSRRKKRAYHREKAERLLRQNRQQEAYNSMKACIDVTPEMAYKLIKRCRQLGVDCIVAPYEADAQLAYLNIGGFADVVITEDSDLLVFGCQRVLFKLDLAGNGLLVEQSILPLAMKIHYDRFSMEKFRHMCILSGCDYLPSLPGIGLCQARKFINNTVEMSTSRALIKWFARMDMADSGISPAEYIEKFNQADSTFQHQPVFDPKSRKVVPLTPVPEGRRGFDFQPMPDDISFQLALGNLNPFTLEKYDDWNPDQAQVQNQSDKTTTTKDSIWSKMGPNPTTTDITPKCGSPSSIQFPVKRNTIGHENRPLDFHDVPPTKRFRIDDYYRHRGEDSRPKTLTIGGWSDEQFYRRLGNICKGERRRDSGGEAYVKTNDVLPTFQKFLKSDGAQKRLENDQLIAEPGAMMPNQEPAKHMTSSSSFKFLKMESRNPPPSNRVACNDKPEDADFNAPLKIPYMIDKQKRKPEIMQLFDQPRKLQIRNSEKFRNTNARAMNKRDYRHYELMYGSTDFGNKLPTEIQLTNSSIRRQVRPSSQHFDLMGRGAV